MSDQQPPGGSPPEYLSTTGPASAPDRDGTPRRSPRWGIAAVAALGVAAAAGAGGWAVVSLMAGGTSAATAVPATALGYLSIDLDPAAGQKIEALRTLKKFPALEAELDLGTRDDLRRWLFERGQAEGACPGVDYAADVEPWLGDRMAFAAVPGKGEEVLPLLVVQVGDQEAAEAGVTKLLACEDAAAAGGRDGEPDPVGTAFVGDYLLVAQTQADADASAAAAEDAPLEDDAAFGEWTGRAGDPGILTAYAAADAPAVLLEQTLSSAGGLPGGLATGAESDELAGQLRSLYADFEGAAMVVRFADGSMEVETAAGGLPDTATGGSLQDSGAAAAALPASTALALSVALPEDWLADYTESMEGLLGPGVDPDRLWSQLEAQSGLSLPEDLETLLGTSVTVAVDGGADLDALVRSGDPRALPAGLRITGKAGEIRRVLDSLLAQAGPAAEAVVVAEDDDGVAVGLQQAYVDRLLADGGLGDSARFGDALPDAERASALLYLDFDAGGWAENLADLLTDGDRDVRANVAPLGGVGLGSWTEDGGQHALLRVTTD